MDRKELLEAQRQSQENMITLMEAYRIECRGCKGKAYAWDAPIGLCKECDKEKSSTEKTLAQCIGGWRSFVEFRFENYAPSPSTQAAFDAANSFNPDQENLFLFGPCGTGKTHLAVAAMRKFWRRGVEFVQPAQIFRRVRGQSGDDEQQEINRLGSLAVLAIDDLGAEKITDFSAQILYDIFDRRLMNFKNGLIITSNLTIAQLADRLGDDRIPSRLAGACRVVEVSGDDQRGKREPCKFDTSWKAKLSELMTIRGCEDCKPKDRFEALGFILRLHWTDIPCPKCNAMHPDNPRHNEYIAAMKLRDMDYSHREPVYPSKTPVGGYRQYPSLKGGR